MEVINNKNPSNSELNKIIRYLEAGKVLVLPTDTIYGLHCDATNNKAVEKILKIKQRNKKNPFLILVSNLKMLENYCYLNKKQKKFLKILWPGPFSAILKKRETSPLPDFTNNGSIGVRIPKNVLLLNIIRKLKKPLISTSLNLTGRKPLGEPKNIQNYFKKYKPDFILDIGSLKNKPSKIIDLRKAGNIKILRK